MEVLQEECQVKAKSIERNEKQISTMTDSRERLVKDNEKLRKDLNKLQSTLQKEEANVLISTNEITNDYNIGNILFSIFFMQVGKSEARKC